MSNIHCGKTYFHPECINKYCNEDNTIKCPICKVDISEKFDVESKRVLRPRFICETNLSNNAIICLFLLFSLCLNCASFTVYSKLPTHSYLASLIFYYVLACLYSVLGYSFLHAYLREYNCECNWILFFLINYGYIFIMVPILFLIMSCISSYHNSTLSSNETGYGTLILIFVSCVINLLIIVFVLLVTILVLLKKCYNYLAHYCTCGISCYSNESVYVVKDSVGADNV